MGPKTYLDKVAEAMRKEVITIREKEAERLEQEMAEEEAENSWTRDDIADFKYDARREA